MTVTITETYAGTDSYIADVEATDDADTTATIPHGLVTAPEEVTITPLLQSPAALSLWAVTTIDETNIVLTKSTTAGSGSAGQQVRMTAKRPHSIGR